MYASNSNDLASRLKITFLLVTGGAGDAQGNAQDVSERSRHCTVSLLVTNTHAQSLSITVFLNYFLMTTMLTYHLLTYH